MAEDSTIALEEYLRIIWHRKWLLVIPMVTLVIVTGLGSLFLTDIYRSYTLILVEPQRVPEEFVRSTVSFSVERHMNTIRQQILSRTLLERVITEYSLYGDLVEKDLPPEEIVDVMRRNVLLRVEGKDAFTLYFQGPDPYLVMQVTNKLASLFIESSTKAREKQAGDTVDFLKSSRDEIKEELEGLEKRIRKFKQKHIGALPEQLEANLRTMEGLQLQLQTNSDALRGAENRYALIAGQLADLRQKSLIADPRGEVVGSDVQLERMKADLANLQLKYTDEHPDVIETKRKIANLEAKMKAPRAGLPGSSMTRGLEMSLQSAQLDINRIRAERAGVASHIRKYQARVENAPKVEQELSILTRDYENKRGAYEDILKKLTEAKRAAMMESKQKGRQFKVVDAAEQPSNPYKPNRPYIVAVGFALGLMIGFGAVFLAEHFDDSFKTPEEMEDTLGLPVLSTIPRIETAADIERRNRLLQSGIMGACAVAGVVVILIIVKYAFKV